MHTHVFTAWLAAMTLSTGCMLTSNEVWDKVDDVPVTGDTDIHLTRINPNSGPRSGGTSVSIAASPINHQPVVTFDGLKADVQDWGSNGVIVITPEFDSVGDVDVEIWSNADYGVAHSAFEVTSH